MAFSEPTTLGIEQAGAGQLVGINNIVLSATDWDDVLTFGLFVQADASGKLVVASDADKPVCISLRNINSDIESKDVYNKSLSTRIDILEDGMATVHAASGVTPTFLSEVTFDTTGPNAGKAKIGTGKANIKFIRVVRDGVWVVRIK